MDELRYLAIFVVVTPLLGAIIIGLLNKRISRDVTNWLSCGLIASSFVASLYILIGFILNRFISWDSTIYVWGQSGTLQIPVGFLIDGLSALMITVVTFVSLTVHVYSIGYMAHDSGYQRFFCYISLFTFAMLMLVMANNFAQLFFGWEAVGLLSYLLIGFWYDKQSATFAGLKAFLVNRVGDVGFILGTAAILFYFNTLQYSQVFSQIPSFMAKSQTLMMIPGYSWNAITFICISLFIGAMAKSAQVPLHVWLPDSMEGPTPISALIHAATMVTAGVFMVARMSPLFENSEVALSLMIVIGTITCLFMGILAVVQSDIKRIVAYSTLSQLGYMVIALGVSAYAAGIFHLVTHAFFKALLFLAAGSVILAVDHEQNIFKMGNLKKYMPITTITMLLGTLALVGFPGTSGFYSKDLIIAAAHNSTLPAANLAYYVALFSVFITSLYSFRMFFVVFYGRGNTPEFNRKNLRESPIVILAPLVLLAIPAIFIGIIMIGPILNDFFKTAIFVNASHNVLGLYRQEEFHGVIYMLKHGFTALPFLMLLLGAVTAWVFYVAVPGLPKKLQKHSTIIANILFNKYGFDLFNEKIIVPTVRAAGKLFWRGGDIACIDGVMVNGTANSIGKLAVFMRNSQTGYLYHYIFIMVAGLVGLLLWTLYV
jgi:NADH-quinone oxidoreductase subunit L